MGGDRRSPVAARRGFYMGGPLDEYLVAVNLIEFRLGGRTYALLIEHVLEVLRLVAITPLPDAPEPVLGVINLRGKAVAVVSLAHRLGVEPPPYHPDTFMVVLAHGESLMAVPIEEVLGVRDVRSEEIEAPPTAGLAPALVGGVISRRDEQVLVLDPVVLFDAGLADVVADANGLPDPVLSDAADEPPAEAATAVERERREISSDVWGAQT